VLDADGKKRLHGAFTGGFSAGYFNTVGSKEGWTPATFVSSRNNRAKIAAARPEDFMDAQDVSEQATGGKEVLCVWHFVLVALVVYSAVAVCGTRVVDIFLVQ